MNCMCLCTLHEPHGFAKSHLAPQAIHPCVLTPSLLQAHAAAALIASDIYSMRCY